MKLKEISTMNKLTEKEWETLKHHMLANISWEQEGSFNRYDEKLDDYVFDKKSAQIVISALKKIRKNFINTK